MRTVVPARIERERNSTSGRTGRRFGQYVGPITLSLVAIVLCLVGPGALMNVAITATVFAIAAQGLTVLSGPVKVISLGAAAFVGLGAFVAAYFIVTSGIDLALALVIAMVVCAAAGLLVAPVASKVGGIQIAVITVGLGFLAQHVFRIVTPWTGGNDGLQLLDVRLAGIDVNAPMVLAGHTVPAETLFFIVCVVVLLVTSLATSNLLRSRIGRAMRMTGTSPLAARSFGISPGRQRAVAFVYAGVLGGLSGGLLAVRQGYIVWDQFGVEMSINLIAVVVLGGLGSVYGAIAGSAVVFALPELIKSFAAVLPLVAAHGETQGITPEQMTAVLYGLLLVVVMIGEPGGMAAVASRLRLHAVTRRELDR